MKVAFNDLLKLLRKYIDQFGSVEYPAPPSCLISVYSTASTDTVPVLHYGVPLMGVDPPVTIFIHRALRTSGPIEGNIVIMIHVVINYLL